MLYRHLDVPSLVVISTSSSDVSALCYIQLHSPTNRSTKLQLAKEKSKFKKKINACTSAVNVVEVYNYTRISIYLLLNGSWWTGNPPNGKCCAATAALDMSPAWWLWWCPRAAAAATGNDDLVRGLKKSSSNIEPGALTDPGVGADAAAACVRNDSMPWPRRISTLFSSRFLSLTLSLFLRHFSVS